MQNERRFTARSGFLSYQSLLSFEARSEGNPIIVSVLIEEFEDVFLELEDGVEPVNRRVDVLHAKARRNTIRILRRLA